MDPPRWVRENLRDAPGMARRTTEFFRDAKAPVFRFFVAFVAFCWLFARQAGGFEQKQAKETKSSTRAIIKRSLNGSVLSIDTSLFLQMIEPIGYVRPRPHPQSIRDPFQCHRRLPSQSARDLDLFGIPLAPPLQFVLLPRQALHLLCHNPLRFLLCA